LKIKVKSYYHSNTFTWSHLVICQKTNVAILIDPVLDFKQQNGTTSTQSSDEIIDYITQNKIDLKLLLETHIHADHLTASAYIHKKLGCKTMIGKGVIEVQKTFKEFFNLGADFNPNGSQFNGLLADKETIKFGQCELTAMHTPGHTIDSMTYIVDDNIFIGDTLFAPNYGSARCDFPGGDAATLYDSVHRIYALGANKKLYLCHDYPKSIREPQPYFLSSEQQENNVHLNKNTSKGDFIKLRENRDKKLDNPKLIFPSVQVNIAAGVLPLPEDNGVSYLKMPISNK
jgi:glyoxylase-like metal-dependent hydrolase (beta-lactamase superfamily II)